MLRLLSVNDCGGRVIDAHCIILHVLVRLNRTERVQELSDQHRKTRWPSHEQMNTSNLGELAPRISYRLCDNPSDINGFLRGGDFMRRRSGLGNPDMGTERWKR